jgi:cytochrome c biogenesis factor
MKDKFKKIFSSFVTTILLLLVYALGLAVATFIEKYQGTAVAKAVVYYSPLFFILQLLLVINFIVVIVKHKYFIRGKLGLVLTHFALIFILLGALTTHLLGKEGILHLREGETSNQIAIQTGDQTTIQTLPFSIELKKFTLTRYPGSASPSSFESEVIVHVDGEKREERIFMNNVLDVKGIAFFKPLMIKMNKVQSFPLIQMS